MRALLLVPSCCTVATMLRLLKMRTVLQAAFEAAFELADSSLSKGYGAACHTAYVFVTDGQASASMPKRDRSGESSSSACVVSICCLHLLLVVAGGRPYRVAAATA